LCVWLGKEKCRKSNFIVQFAICAALGRDFLGLKFKARRPLDVVILDFESPTDDLLFRTSAIESDLDLSDEDSEDLWENLRIVELRRMQESGEWVPKFSARGEANERWCEIVSSYKPDIWIVDPLRSFHGYDENKSSVMENLLTEMRNLFKPAALVTPHHLRKVDRKSAVSLKEDMRSWSDGARGSGAIKAHADVIVGQERRFDTVGNEIVDFAAYMKGGGDIQPFSLMESGPMSFWWNPLKSEISAPLKKALQALGSALWTRTQAIQQIQTISGASQATAYRQFNEMVRLDLVMNEKGVFKVR